MKPNKKKCEICGYEFDDDADIEELLTKVPSKCPFCIKVLELINIIEQYNLLHFENVLTCFSLILICFGYKFFVRNSVKISLPLCGLPFYYFKSFFFF